MKIDTHQHFWHYQSADFPWIDERMTRLRQDRLPADSASAMRACGVDAVIAVQARGALAETDFLLALAAREPRILGVVGWADLQSPALAAQLDDWAGQGALRGLRHILQDEAALAALIAQPAFNQGLALLQQRQLVYEVLVFDRQLPTVVDFCARHAAHWLVLDHLGKPALRDWFSDAQVAPRWAACLRELAAMPHVLCKLSGLVTETDWPGTAGGLRARDEGLIHACFDQALEAFGPQRLMFGSDWPVCELAAPYATVHRLARSWAESRLTAAQQEAFWSGNALRCYGLAPPAARPDNKEI